MIDTLKLLWKNAGLANIGLAIAAAAFLVLWIIFGWGDFAMIGFFCMLSACIALNWQALMQKTTYDEKALELLEKAKIEWKEEKAKAEAFYQEQLIELKKYIIGLKDENKE